MEWISVEDRLPEEYTDVIGYGHLSGYAYTCPIVVRRSERGGWFELGDRFPNFINYGYKITHWMPLPDPPTIKP